MIPADTQKPAETTLQQINEKKYDAELTAAGVKTIYKYGVAFSGKKVEVAVGWEMEIHVVICTYRCLNPAITGLMGTE